MSYTINRSQTLTITDCYRCGAPIALTKDMNQRLINTHASFCCPNGHGQHYVGKSDAERLRDQLKAANARVDEERRLAQHQRDLKQTLSNRLRAEKGAKTKLKKRIHNGVCPCCTRSFGNLREHMKRIHPEYAESKS